MAWILLLLLVNLIAVYVLCHLAYRRGFKDGCYSTAQYIGLAVESFKGDLDSDD